MLHGCIPVIIEDNVVEVSCGWGGGEACGLTAARPFGRRPCVLPLTARAPPPCPRPPPLPPQSFGTLLNYRAFSVRVAEVDVPRLDSILRSIPAAEVAAKRALALQLAPRLEWSAGSMYLAPFPSTRGDPMETLMGALYQKLRMRENLS